LSPGRRSLGVLALAGWLLGVEALPAAHVGWHELWEDHHHEHGTAPEPEPEHGDHSIAHHGVALLPGGLVLVVAPPAAFSASAPPALAGVAGSSRPETQRARGPPSNRRSRDR
jgi:hypothetical protein